MYQTATLPNGLRIIFEKTSSPVVYCGYVVCAGTRHEAAADSGMAHFIEHMTFKGTARRRAWQINSQLERVGGDLNAFTTKQETVFTATVLRQDFARAAELLSDIVFNSTFPQNEIDREVEVICDEIESYQDTPSDLIFDEFEQILFSGSSLGRDILGKAESLRKYSTADALRFARHYYRPDNCAFYATGNLDFQKIVPLLLKYTADFAADTGRDNSSDYKVPASELVPAGELPRLTVSKRSTHQAHVLTGARTFGGSDSQRYALMLLNNLLGGPGMNSRLGVRLREKAGLVYTIDSYVSLYPDLGAWCVYFGCDAHDVERCLRLVRSELDRLSSKPLGTAQLRAAKKQYVGQIGISRDSFESYAVAMGKTFAHYGNFRDLDEVCRCLNEVTAADIQQLAAALFDESKMITLIYK